MGGSIKFKFGVEDEIEGVEGVGCVEGWVVDVEGVGCVDGWVVDVEGVGCVDGWIVDVEGVGSVEFELEFEKTLFWKSFGVEGGSRLS